MSDNGASLFGANGQERGSSFSFPGGVFQSDGDVARKGNLPTDEAAGRSVRVHPDDALGKYSDDNLPWRQ